MMLSAGGGNGVPWWAEMVVRLAPGARDDLDAIWDYVAREARDEGPAD